MRDGFPSARDQQMEPVVQPGSDLFDTQQVYAGRSQLKRQWDPVEMPAPAATGRTRAITGSADRKDALFALVTCAFAVTTAACAAW